MFKQVIMWKLKAKDNEPTRHKTAETIKDMLDELPKIIHIINQLEVGVNNNFSTDYYNLVLIAEFDTYEDMIIFHEHHQYQKIVEYMTPFIANRKVVEYAG